MKYTTPSKDESFPSKERPLLGRLESRRVREGFVYLWMLCSSFRISKVSIYAFPI
jgi:hypothetical protein